MENEVIAAEQEKAKSDFRVRDERKAWFVKEFAKLVRRAEKIGCPAPTYAFGPFEDVRRVRREEVGEDPQTGRPLYAEVEEVVRYWPVHVEGAAPKFAGWTLAATLQVLVDEKTGERHVIVRSISDVAAPQEFRDGGRDGDCDHCRTSRLRKDTFLVRHDSGEWKRVGRQCIRDFLGHNSPEHIARWAEILMAARDLGGEGGRDGTSDRWPLDLYLGYVAAVMNRFGWVSKSKAEELQKRPTASVASDHMAPSKELLRMQREGKWERIQPKPADEARGAEALEWARNLTEDEVAGSDYLYNLRVIALVGAVEPRTLGYAASVVIAFDKAMDRVRAKKELPPSNHVGTVGERRVFDLVLAKVFPVQGDWGTSYVHLFRDADGNDFKWFGSRRLERNGADVADGEVVRVKATVKKHDEYKGRRQTALSRCELHVEKPKKNKANAALANMVVVFLDFAVGEALLAHAVCCLLSTWTGVYYYNHDFRNGAGQWEF